MTWESFAERFVSIRERYESDLIDLRRSFVSSLQEKFQEMSSPRRTVLVGELILTVSQLRVFYEKIAKLIEFPLVTLLSDIFHRGFPFKPKMELSKAIKSQISRNLDETESEAFIVSMFQKSTDSGCNRQEPCRSENCQTCLTLYLIFGIKQSALLRKRKNIYVKYLRQIYLYGYLEFLFQDDDFMAVKTQLMNSPSGQAHENMTQMNFIERYILGNSRIQLGSNLEIFPDKVTHVGTYFTSYINEIHPELIGNLVDMDYFNRTMLTKFGESLMDHVLISNRLIGKFRASTSSENGGIATRSNAPFLDDPEKPKFLPRSSLNGELTSHLRNITDSYKKDKGDLSQIAQTSLKVLMQPYFQTMSNLVGGVHNCNQETMLQMIKKLDLNSESSVLLELGSGAPLFGLQASIFTKVTICVDLPCVMKTIFLILSFLSAKDQAFARTIHYVPGL